MKNFFKKISRKVEKFDERLGVLLDDMKDTLIKSSHDKMNTLQERFWSDR